MIHSGLLHKLLVLLTLSMAANLDNLGVGIAYGTAQNSIPAFQNFLIAGLSSGLTYLAMAFGSIVALLLPIQLANDIGAIMLIAVGIWVYWESSARRSWARSKFHGHAAILPKNMNSGRQKRIPSQVLTLTETLILGVSLALNAMVGGFSASLAGYNPIPMSIIVGLFSYFAIAIGQIVSASLLSKWLGKLAQKAAGLLLIAIGGYELVF